MTREVKNGKVAFKGGQCGRMDQLFTASPCPREGGRTLMTFSPREVSS